MADSRRPVVGEPTAASFLLDTVSELIESTDRREISERLAARIVPFLADSTAIHVRIGEGSDLLAARHVEPEKSELIQRAYVAMPHSPDALFGVPAVLRTGRAELVPEIQPWMREMLGGQNPEHRRMIEELAVQSWILAPIVSGDQVWGVFSFASSVSNRRYDERDLEFAIELGRRIGPAFRQAHLFERARLDADRAAKASTIKDEFLAMVSHELRTPLNAILGWSEMLGNRKLRPEVRERAIDVIARNARAQAKLINDLLDFSHQVKGRLRLEFGALDLRTVIDNAVRSVRPLADAKELDIVLTLQDAADCVRGDPQRMGQVVLNLLTNAIKFTPVGGKIEISLRATNGHCELSVRDSGQGIAPEFLPHVFESFRQEVDGRGGLGLGLAIARDLVHAHRGNIRVESEGRGQGATFIVELPIDEGQSSRDSRPALGNDVRELTAHLEGVRALVVDDDDDARTLVHEILAYCGAEVHSSPGATHALSLLDRMSFDVVISDLSMPDGDGFALARAARQSPRSPMMIALSAYGRENDRERAKAAGFAHHLLKPISPSLLVRTVATRLGRDPGSTATEIDES